MLLERCENTVAAKILHGIATEPLWVNLFYTSIKIEQEYLEFD
jgi:hypothetical protein